MVELNLKEKNEPAELGKGYKEGSSRDLGWLQKLMDDLPGHLPQDEASQVALGPFLSRSHFLVKKVPGRLGLPGGQDT